MKLAGNAARVNSMVITFVLKLLWKQLMFELMQRIYANLLSLYLNISQIGRCREYDDLMTARYVGI